jgi:hypothetical protein
MHFPDSSRIDEINWRVTAARRDVVEGGVCSLAEGVDSDGEIVFFIFCWPSVTTGTS